MLKAKASHTVAGADTGLCNEEGGGLDVCLTIQGVCRRHTARSENLEFWSPLGA